MAARWLLGRSADMVAAGLAAVAEHLNEGNLAIQAEGGLFWKATGYRDRVESTLTKLINRKFAIIRGQDVNLVGAAAAALAFNPARVSGPVEGTTSLSGDSASSNEPD